MSKPEAHCTTENPCNLCTLTFTSNLVHLGGGECFSPEYPICTYCKELIPTWGNKNKRERRTLVCSYQTAIVLPSPPIGTGRGHNKQIQVSCSQELVLLAVEQSTRLTCGFLKVWLWGSVSIPVSAMNCFNVMNLTTVTKASKRQSASGITS